LRTRRAVAMNDEKEITLNPETEEELSNGKGDDEEV
jgi:hypothetical protein